MEGIRTEILKKYERGLGPWEELQSTAFVSHLTNYAQFHVDKDLEDWEEMQIGKEIEGDHQIDADKDKRIIQNKIGANAQERGAKWGM